MVLELQYLLSGEHYLSLMLILILSCLLLGRNMLSERVRQDSFWITVLACGLLLVQDVLLSYAQQDPARSELRMAMTIAGYALRPTAVLGFLLVVWPTRYPRWFLWIPVLLNAMLYCTAIFSSVTFSFTKDYAFQPGPLVHVMFYICMLYLVLTLFMVHVRFKDRRAGDIFVIYLCAFGCVGANLVDIFVGGISTVPATLISSMTFYLFLRTQDMDHDPLTHLWNRLSFYEDCRKCRNTISAVASIDMNGLKKTNDELGHEAGDRALRMIGRALRGVMNRKVISYRIGGDEFMILFLHCDEAEMNQALVDMINEVTRVGLSVSVGVATREEAQDSLEEMLRLSDRRMYEEKSMYYHVHDRRKNRSN